MRRRNILTTLMLILAFVLPAAVVADDPLAPTTRLLFRVAGLPVDGAAEVVHQVNDFQPGQQTSVHTHPGLTVVSVLAGELTYTNQAGDRAFKAGESFFERPDVVHFARNAGTTPTRIVTSYVQAKGATVTTPQPGGPSPAPPAPTTPHLSRADATLPGAPYEVAQVVLDFAPGAQTPAHTHPGQVFVTVLEGAVTFRTGGAERTYQVGESFVERPGVVGQARNAGTVPASVLATYLLPKGAPLSVPVAMPSMPATGAGGTAHRLPVLGVALLLGGLLLAGGWGMRRRLGGA